MIATDNSGPLKVKAEVGLAEAVAAITLGSVVASALFNIGFFSKMHWSYVSLLSPQDIALGTFAAAPIISIAAPGLYYLTVDKSRFDRRITILYIGISTVIFWILLFISDFITQQKLAPLLSAAAWIVGVGAAFSIVSAWKKLSFKLVMALAALALLILPVIAGRAAFQSWSTTGLDPLHRIVLNTAETREVQLIRTTSQYAFYVYQDSLVLSKMADIREIKQSSTEARPWVR